MQVDEVSGVIATIDLEVFGKEGLAAENLHVDLGVFFDLHHRAAFAIIDVSGDFVVDANRDATGSRRMTSHRENAVLLRSPCFRQS